MKFDLYVATHELRPDYYYVGCHKHSTRAYNTSGWPRKLWKDSGIRPTINVIAQIEVDEDDNVSPYLLERALFDSLKNSGVNLDQHRPNVGNPWVTKSNTIARDRLTKGEHFFTNKEERSKHTDAYRNGAKLGAKNQPHSVRVAQGKRAGKIAKESGQLRSIAPLGGKNAARPQLCLECHRVSQAAKWWHYKNCEHLIKVDI